MVKFLLLYMGIFCAYGQCCSPGNPLGGQSTTTILPAQQLALFANFKYGNSSSYFNESTKTVGVIKSGEYIFSGLNVSYGISKRVMIESETGYMISKSQHYSEGILPDHLRGTGFTDQLIGIKLAIVKNVQRELEFGSGLGIKFPLGKSDALYHGTILPRDLQTTTGSTDLIHTVYVYKGFLNRHLRLFLTNRMERRGTNPDNYHYGNLLATSLYLTWSKFKHWTIVSEFRTEFRQRDKRLATGFGIPVDPDHELVIPTGSEKLFISPQIVYRTSNSFSVSLFGDIPVYQHYNNKQLGNSFALGLGLRKQLTLK